MTQKHQALITKANDDLWKLERSWQTVVFSANDGIGSMDSGVSEFLCKRFRLQLTEMRSPN